MMRTCHVIESAGGGSGQVVLDLLRTGIAAGDSVTLVFAPNRAEPDFLLGLRELPSVTILECPMRRAVGIHDFKDAWGLFRTLKRAGPFDIIHAHSSKAGALTRLAGLLLPGALIYTPHAFITMAPNASPVYAWTERLLSRFCKAIIAVSEQERRHAHEVIGIKPAKLRLIPNGVDLQVVGDRGSARTKMGLPGDCFAIGFVGRLVAQKNPLQALAAFARIAGKFPNARLVVIGDGGLSADCERFVLSMGLQQRVQLLGQVSSKELMAGFDCLLCSSDYESFGLIFLEALRAGVLIVSPPVGVAELAIVEGSTGFLASDNRPTSLADCLATMLGLTTTQLAQMREACYRRAQMFSIERMASMTRALYREQLTA